MTLDRVERINDLILSLYRDIRDAHLWGMSYGEISARLGMPRSTVQKICGGHDPRFTVRPAEAPDADWRITLTGDDGAIRGYKVTNRPLCDDDRVAFVMPDGTIRTETVADAMRDTNGLARHLKTLSEIFDQLEAPKNPAIQVNPNAKRKKRVYTDEDHQVWVDNDPEQE